MISLPPKLNAHDMRRVCVEACCDPRAVRRLLSGQLTRPSTADRIRKALEKLDLMESAKR